MIPDVELYKQPLETLYREMIRRYLSLNPSKSEYSTFIEAVEGQEKALANSKPRLRAKFIELCKSMVACEEDKIPGHVFIAWDD